MRVDTNIKKARLQAYMTQEQVAEKLNVSRQTVSNWENGKTFPDTANIIRLSEMYHVSTDFLLRGVEDESVPDAVRQESEENPTVKIPETTMGKGKSTKSSLSISSDITRADAVARLVSRSNVYEILMDRDDVIETLYSVHDTLFEDVKDYLYDASCEQTGMDVDMSIIEESYNQTLTAYISYIEQNKTLTEEQEDMIQELRVMLV